MANNYQDSISTRLTGRHKKSFMFVGAATVAHQNILDIGCSYGWFDKWAVENQCNSITGIEPDEKDFSNALREVPESIYLQGSALSIPLNNDSIDVVVLWEVLEHLPKHSEEKALHEISRVLKANGEIFLSTPHFTFWSCVLDPAWWLIGHRHYSLSELNDMADRAGYVIEKVEYGGGLWELGSMILLYIFKWIFRREIPFKEWFEKQRDKEFLSSDKWATIFVKFRKV